MNIKGKIYTEIEIDDDEARLITLRYLSTKADVPYPNRFECGLYIDDKKHLIVNTGRSPREDTEDFGELSPFQIEVVNLMNKL